MSDSDVIKAVDANPVPSPPPVLAAVAAVSQAEPTVAERLAGILTLAVESSSKVNSDCVSCFAKFGFTAGAPAGCSCSLEAQLGSNSQCSRKSLMLAFHADLRKASSLSCEAYGLG